MSPPSRLLASTAALAILLTGCGGEGDEAGIRHVLVITLDTTRADHLSCYGGSRFETPALDALADQGVRFEDCTAPAATTLSSHASLMTGTYPHRHGAVRNGFALDPGNRTLAESLREMGFWCAAVVGSSALVARTGLDQGFHHYDDAFDESISAGGNDQAQRRASSVTEAVLTHVDEVLARPGSDGARLFLFAHYFDPHAPYAPLPEFAQGAKLAVGDFDDIERAVRSHQQRVLGEPLGQQAVISGGLRPALAAPIDARPSSLDRDLAFLYGAEVVGMDREIGRLLAGLTARGILDDTLVVVTADHGETFWERGNFWNHGLWVGQSDVHVPLLVRPPRSTFSGQGRTVAEPVSGVDVAPTILDLLGATPEPEADPGRGRSLVAALDGSALPPRAVFSEATQPGPSLESGDALPWRGARKPHAARLGRWKLVAADYLSARQLFDLASDRDESVDLLADDELTPEAQSALGELDAAYGKWRDAARPLPSEFDESQVPALIGLGYAEAGGEEPEAGAKER
ncbi:MAG: sulfatase [Planctomycetota bacterium]